MAKLSEKERLAYFKKSVPTDLIESFEAVRESLSELTDIVKNPGDLFSTDLESIVVDRCLESVTPVIEGAYGCDEDNYLVSDDSADEEDVIESLHMSSTEMHEHNIKMLLENSAEAMRATPNQRNLNELTPFDAFLPWVIIRSYLALVGPNLIPTQVPTQDFIKFKRERKYVVTKDNTRYLRPDVYNEPEQVAGILNSAKGDPVFSDWFPAAKEVEKKTDGTEAPDAGTYDYVIDAKGQGAIADKTFYKLPDKCDISNFDLLEKSGGLRAAGDSLDIDICIDSVKCLVEHDGQPHIVEVMGLECYPDVGSISPQRSVSATIPIQVTDEHGNVIATYTDKIYGDYNASTATFNLVSLKGYVRQVKFGGHLSNKNNAAYFNFTNEFETWAHPIPEGYRCNVPITVEDMQLYNKTASIDIVAYSINEMTELFTQMEDAYMINVINKSFEKWNNVTDHPFEYFAHAVSFTKEVDVTYNKQRLLKRNEAIQDDIQYALSRTISEIRNICKNEPFKVRLFAHPNIATLFVGENIDWKVTNGGQITDSIRADYNMGIYTCQGDSMMLVTSQKFREEDGLCGLIFPIDEKNFISWRHYKQALYFDKDHRISEMPNVPNIVGISRFLTKDYIPLQFRLKIKNYDK